MKVAASTWAGQEAPTVLLDAGMDVRGERIGLVEWVAGLAETTGQVGQCQLPLGVRLLLGGTRT